MAELQGDLQVFERLVVNERMTIEMPSPMHTAPDMSFLIDGAYDAEMQGNEELGEELGEEHAGGQVQSWKSNGVIMLIGAQSVAAPADIFVPIVENHYSNKKGTEEAESKAQQQGSDKSDDDRTEAGEERGTWFE